MLGLPTGLLLAGIPAVVGTLWPVSDRSTALLVTRFYEYLIEGDPAAGLLPQPVPAALRRAQLWLRDLTNAELGLSLEARRTRAGARPTGAEAAPPEAPRHAAQLYLQERRRVRQALAAGRADARPYSHPVYWAPFVAFGADVEVACTTL